MKRIANAATALILGLFLALPYPAFGEPLLEPHLERFDRTFRQMLGEQGVPGAAYVVVSGDRILRIGTHGRTAEGGPPVTPETVFRLASVSKGFAGTLAAMLAHEGAFAFDEPITRYRPDFLFQGPHQTLTVRDVLSQSSGFIPNAYDNLIEAGKTLDEIIPHFRTLSPLCAPGSCYTYQNSVFSLIEPVLESAGRATYGDLLAHRIFAPLGMRQASIGYEPFLAATNRAEPHVRTQLRQWRTVSVSPNYYRVGAAAGINASAVDMGRWMIALLGHRPDVIAPEVIDRITTPEVRTRRDLNSSIWRNHLNDAHYGLGWRLYHFGGERLVYHGGWVSGYRADISLSRERELGIVILANAETNLVSELTVSFWAGVSRDIPFELLADNASAQTLPAVDADSH